MTALLITAGLGLFSMMGGLFKLPVRWALIVSCIGLLGAALGSFLEWNSELVYFGMAYFDNYALAFSALICMVTFFVFSLSEVYFDDVQQYGTEHIALFLFAVCGMICMVSFENMAMLFLGIEIMSVSLYILAGTRKKDLASNEASLKYLLMGSFTTGILLMGITLLYGATGSFQIDEIAAYIELNTDAFKNPLLIASILFLVVGLSFKISAAPFHFWTPDVYQGSPTLVTMFMSTAVKIAGFAAFYKLFSSCFLGVEETWVNIIYVLAGLTITLGSITALYQSDVKRTLAYSSIAHAGYLMIALLVAGTADSAIWYYGLAYAISSLVALSIVMLVQKSEKSTSFDAFNGLAQSKPFLAATLTLSMISLAGIPLTGGFFAKFYLLYNGMESGYTPLVILAIINAIIGIYYYFKVIMAMYLKPAESEFLPINPSVYFKTCLIILSVLTIQMGIFPDLFYSIF